MSVIPVHKLVRQSDFGILLKEVSSSLPKEEPVGYAHHDDYYVFGMVDRGNCCINVDFKDYWLSESEVMCIQPGQVHRVTSSNDVKAFCLFVDSVFLDFSAKQIIAEYALCPHPFRISKIQLSELKRIFVMIARRKSSLENNDTKRIVQSLSCVVIEMITEVMRSTIRYEQKNRRCIEITLAFRELLSKELQTNRSPAHYADLLRISSVYLNEVIKGITGVSVSQYIQNELIVRAKRMLVYTSLNINEVALELGFDDCAYFTRLFTKKAGISPTLYRKKYLE